jgi:hypothetical protein
LYGKLSARDQKYLRNINRFQSNGNRRESIRENYTNPLAYYMSNVDVDTGTLPAINVGRSMALTLQSKLAQTKGRVFFDAVNGSWETVKLIRNAQVYFDAFTDMDKTYSKQRSAILSALVFEMGIIHIDIVTKSTEIIRPWEYYVDPAEVTFGKVSRSFTKQEQYPLKAVQGKLTPNLKSLLERDPHAKVSYFRYYDLEGKKRRDFVNSDAVAEYDLESDINPFSIFYYQEPFKGLYSTSLLDNVRPNQMQIDDILQRIHDALTLSPANTIYVPTGNDYNIAKMISNKVGNVVPYNPAAGSVVVATPAPIDPGYYSALEFFIRQSYESEGISMLSAQSKKPSGVNSGVALDTLQDVESERFQAVLDQLIQFQKDIVDIMIEVFPADDDILPKEKNRANTKWKDIKKARKNYTLQSSLASVLSKDPKVKMEQIEKLQQQGIINPYMAASLLEIPDINKAYSTSTASYDNCNKIIERAIDKDYYEFYDVVNLQQLMEVAVNTLLQLDSVDEDPENLARIVKLISIVTEKMQKVENVNNPPPQINPIDGGQLKSAMEVVQSVNAGYMSPQAGQALIMAVGIPADQAQIMVSPPPPPPPELTPPPVQGIDIEQGAPI